MIDQIIAFNKDFVAQKGYEKYFTNKYPDKKLAVLSCMDIRPSQSVRLLKPSELIPLYQRIL